MTVPQIAQGKSWAPVPVQPGSEPPAGGRTAFGDHFSLALYYQRAGDFEKALAQYRALLRQNERNADAHNNLGVLYQERGMRKEAIAEFRRALTIDNGYAKAHNNLGVGLLNSGSPDEAATEFRAALSLQPGNTESLVNLALAQKALGRPDEARATLLGALERDPRHAPLHYNLAVLFEEAGDIPRAIQHYRHFVSYGGFEYASVLADVQKRIEMLEDQGARPRPRD